MGGKLSIMKMRSNSKCLYEFYWNMNEEATFNGFIHLSQNSDGSLRSTSPQWDVKAQVVGSGVHHKISLTNNGNERHTLTQKAGPKSAMYFLVEVIKKGLKKNVRTLYNVLRGLDTP